MPHKPKDRVLPFYGGERPDGSRVTYHARRNRNTIVDGTCKLGHKLSRVTSEDARQNVSLLCLQCEKAKKRVNCEYCLNPFTPKSSTHIFCSEACRLEDEKNPLPKLETIRIRRSGSAFPQAAVVRTLLAFNAQQRKYVQTLVTRHVSACTRQGAEADIQETLLDALELAQRATPEEIQIELTPRRKARIELERDYSRQYAGAEATL